MNLICYYDLICLLLNLKKTHRFTSQMIENDHYYQVEVFIEEIWKSNQNTNDHIKRCCGYMIFYRTFYRCYGTRRVSREHQ